MRRLLFAAAIVIGAVGASTVAQAQNYPWCAYYSGSDGARNCGFVSFQQCMADVSGIGGFCQRNTTYAPQERQYYDYNGSSFDGGYR